MNKNKLRFVLLAATAAMFAGSAAGAIITFGPSALGPAVPDALDLSGNAPGSIVSTTITIPGGNDYIINPGNSVTITLTGLNHTFMSDLEFQLTGPVGSPHLMFDNRNGSCNFGAGNTYNFNSGNPALACTSGTMTAGNYAAEPGFSSAWSGVNIDNTQWTLSIQDFFAQDTQSAGWQWSITVDADPANNSVPEPATLGTVFAGLVLACAAYRRRS